MPCGLQAALVHTECFCGACVFADQVVQRRGEQDDALNTKLQEQLLSSVENGLGLSGGSGQAAGLEGLAENA